MTADDERPHLREARRDEDVLPEGMTERELRAQALKVPLEDFVAAERRTPSVVRVSGSFEHVADTPALRLDRDALYEIAAAVDGEHDSDFPDDERIRRLAHALVMLGLPCPVDVVVPSNEPGRGL